MVTGLCELTAALVTISQPLKWDVFNARGELLLHKGYVVLSESQLDSLLERGMYANASEVEKPKLEKRPVEYDPFMEWDMLAKKTGRLNLAYLSGNKSEVFESIDEIVLGIEMLLDKNPDAAIFELMQMDVTDYVATHNLQTAVLTSLLVKRMNWDTSNVITLCSASSTMNIAILELQSVLSAQKDPITPEQSKELSDHGKRGRMILEELGVSDLDWLRAVEEHHPEAIPQGNTPSEMASIIHHADVYMAKISPRAYRIAKPPNLAAKEMLQGKGLSQTLAGIIIKEIGIYPPGSYVRLANGETAIVTHRGLQAHTPTVFSLINANGMPLGEPVLRDTTAATFAINAIVPKSKVMVTLNRTKLFGRKKYSAFG